MLVMQDALQRNAGIIVDTHLKHCFIALGWCDSTSPETIAREVESWLPKSYWPKVGASHW